MRRRGVGVVNPGPYGITVDAMPTCLQPYERLEIEQRCPTPSYTLPPITTTIAQEPCPPGMGRNPRTGQCYVLAGLGAATGPLSGRLAPFDACSLKAMNLPSCATPSCIDEVTAGFIAACATGDPVPPDVKAWCDSGAALAYFNLPYCARPGWMFDPPACVSAETRAGIDYCLAYGYQGTDTRKNILCWAMMKEPVWWNAMTLRQACAPEVQPPPGPLPLPPPPPPPPRPPAEDRAFAAMGTIGILLAVGIAGGGYYAWRRRRRR